MKWPTPAIMPSVFKKKRMAKYLADNYAISHSTAMDILDELEFNELPLQLAQIVFELSAWTATDPSVGMDWVKRIRSQ